MCDIFKEKAEIWNNRLKQCLKGKGYTQTSFADELNSRNKYLEKSVTQKTVSRWTRVGNIDGKTVIGFPNYDNMVRIAQCLNVNVGYLTGETDNETFTLEKASKLLNLDNETLKTIIKITGKEKTCINFGHESENYRKILNIFFTSKKFLDIMKIMLELENIYIQNKKSHDIQKELGYDISDKAMKIYLSNNFDADLTQEECDDNAKIDRLIDTNHKKDYDFQREISFNRFKLQEAFTLLLNELYPDIEE